MQERGHNLRGSYMCAGGSIDLEKYTKKCHQELGPIQPEVEPFRLGRARLVSGMYNWAKHFSS